METLHLLGRGRQRTACAIAPSPGQDNRADFPFTSAQNQPSFPGLQGHWELWSAQLHIVALPPGVAWPKDNQLS